MNRRRKVGSTLILSSVAALSIVGMGLAAAVTPVSTEASFGFEFVPTPDVPTDIGVLTAPDMSNIKLVVDETSKKVSLKNPIVFTFTPDESIADHTFELTYTFTMPENFDDYFTLTTPLTGTIEADDASTLAAETDITFTIGTDKIAGTLTGNFDEAQAAFAESSIKVSATVNDVTGSEPADVAVESITLNQNALEITVGGEDVTLTATVKPDNATNPTVTWESDHPEFATVTNGVVHAVAEGTATITAKAGDKTATCVVTVKAAEAEDPFADAIPVTVSEFLDATEPEGKLYKLTGVIGEIDNTTYGNGMIYDKTTGESLKLYGLTGTKTALSTNENAWSFKNPQDYETTVADQFETGDEIVIYGVYDNYNGTKEIMGVFDSVATDKSEITYTVTAAVGIENGSISFDKNSGIYGEEVTITLTPDEGFNVGSVTVNGNQISPTEDVYKFNIVPGANEVSATFVDESIVYSSFEITSTNLGLGGSYGDGSKSLNVESNNVGISWIQLMDSGNGMQWRYKSQTASTIWNTTEFPYAISSIELNWHPFTSGSLSNSTKADLSVTFGTSEITENGTEKDVTFTTGETKETIICDVDGAKYFRINHGTESGTFYIDSIVINYVAA